MANNAETLRFTEIAGQHRSVLLANSTAPMGHVRSSSAFELGGEVRRSLHYEPGTDEPTVHVMGINQRDLIVHGHIRQSLLSQTIGTIAGTATTGSTDLQEVSTEDAYELVQLIESVRSAGGLLRIVWGQIVRTGFLRESKFGVEGEGEFTYELTFDVYNQGDRKPKVATKPVSFPSIATSIDDNVTKLRSFLRIPGLSLPLDGVFDGLISAIANPVGEMLRILGDAEAVLEDTAAAIASAKRRYQQLANSAKRVKDRAEELKRVVEVAVDHQGDPPDVFDRVTMRRNRLAAMIALKEIIYACNAIGTAAETRILGGSSGRVYRTTLGDTIEFIAVEFGVSTESVRALNPEVPVGVLSVGTQIILPVSAAGG
jgi:hypothetical protein